jgi:hypothetical protein
LAHPGGSGDPDGVVHRVRFIEDAAGNRMHRDAPGVVVGLVGQDVEMHAQA